MNWFEVDKQGLAKLLEQRGKSFAILELLQNAWDQNVTRVDVRITRVPSSPFVAVSVEDDDPEGFKDLSHAFTLFAESTKKADPEKRGRFNLGEKLVLAVCSKAAISSTTGTVEFDDDGRHVRRGHRRAVGSLFTGLMRMTNDEMLDAIDQLERCIPAVATFINDVPLLLRGPLATWSDRLTTEVADAEGYLRRVSRQAPVVAYAVLDGETGTLYEMGIPVVETGDAFHVNIGQKVPLTLDRQNVPPSFLSAVRVGMLRETVGLLTTKEQATAPWVREAASHPEVGQVAIGRVLDLRFGERRVAYDPSDVEANKQAVMEGYTVVTGGSLSAGEWESARTYGAVPPAGQVTPSPKPFSADGSPLRTIAEADQTEAMRRFVAWVKHVAPFVIDAAVDVRLANDRGWGFAGCFGGGQLTVNVAKYGGVSGFFADGPTPQLVELIIHEFAHHYEKDHLSREFYEACCTVGARLAFHVADHPNVMRSLPVLV